jgi:Fungal chitosanase of glycosyl hydrolase group 75
MDKLKKEPTVHKATAKGLLGGTWEYVDTLEGCKIYKSYDLNVCRIVYIAKMAVDCDGMPVNTYNDPYWQRETSLFYNGSPINADKVPYIVVPPKVRNCVAPIVMGCMSLALNITNGKVAQSVVADQGPQSKIGEASCECAERVGLDRNPNHGGTDDHIICYLLWPGIPATVDGITYNLQAA